MFSDKIIGWTFIGLSTCCVVFYTVWVVFLVGCVLHYRNDPLFKFSDRQVWANSADPDQTAPLEEQSDLGSHCLLFHLQPFDKIA